MKKTPLIFLLFICFTSLYSQRPEETEDWSRKPAIVIPGKNTMPPSDALVLYGSARDSINWEEPNRRPFRWKANDSLTITKNSGSIQTKLAFGNVQLHVEWRTPAVVSDTGQGRGNSGVFLMSKYEVQVLDSYENETYYNGMAGSVYKQHIPLVNASTGPGNWQTYDMIFTAPVFNEDQTLRTPAFITVFHNGVLIQNHVELKGPTEYIGQPVYKYHESKLPIMLQNHGNPVSYRNIWVREL